MYKWGITKSIYQYHKTPYYHINANTYERRHLVLTREDLIAGVWKYRIRTGPLRRLLESLGIVADGGYC
jgi:hypothetical protein